MSNSGFSCWYTAVDRLGELDQVVGSRRQLHDPDLPESRLPLVHHQVLAERVGRVDLHVGPVGEHLGPALARGLGHRRRDQAEVGGAVVGGDEEPVVVVRHRVLDARAPRLDGPERLVRLVGAGVAHLRRAVAGDVEHHERVAAGAADVDEERLVGLEVHQRVLGGIGAQQVTMEPAGTARLVEHDVEQGAAVVGPRQAGRDVDHGLRQQCPGRELLHVQRERLGAARVHRVRQQPVVGAHVPAAQPEIVVAARERIEIEDDLLAALVLRRAAAVDRILRALRGAVIVEPAVQPLRHREIGLPDPRAHLLEQLLLQRLRRPHHGLGVRILSREIRQHFRILAVPKPEVLVHPGLAVDRARPRHRAGDRGSSLGDRERGETVPDRGRTRRRRERGQRAAGIVRHRCSFECSNPVGTRMTRSADRRPEGWPWPE